MPSPIRRNLGSVRCEAEFDISLGRETGRCRDNQIDRRGFSVMGGLGKNNRVREISRGGTLIQDPTFGFNMAFSLRIGTGTLLRANNLGHPGVDINKPTTTLGPLDGTDIS